MKVEIDIPEDNERIQELEQTVITQTIAISLMALVIFFEALIIWKLW